MSVQKVLLCPFHCKPSPSGVSLKFLGLKNIPPSSGISTRSMSNSRCDQGGLGYSFSLKSSGAIFRPRSSKVCVQKLVLCEFQYKPWPSGVSLESPGLENIPQVPGIGAEVDQIHDARNVVSATVSVLKSSVPIFRPTS